MKINIEYGIKQPIIQVFKILEDGKVRQRDKDSEERTARKGRKGLREKDGEARTVRKGRKGLREKDGEARTARQGQ